MPSGESGTRWLTQLDWRMPIDALLFMFAASGALATVASLRATGRGLVDQMGFRLESRLAFQRDGAAKGLGSKVPPDR